MCQRRTSPAAGPVTSTSKWTDDGIVLSGTLAAKPNQRYAIELFGSRADDHRSGAEHGWGAGERYPGTASAVTDARGSAPFRLSLDDLADPFGNGQTNGFFAPTATDAAGSTSIFSRSLPLRKK